MSGVVWAVYATGELAAFTWSLARMFAGSPSLKAKIEADFADGDIGASMTNKVLICALYGLIWPALLAFDGYRLRGSDIAVARLEPLTGVGGVIWSIDDAQALEVVLDRVSELEAVVERVGLLLAESRITPAGRQPIPAGDLHDALKGSQDAQEAAQGDDRGEVGSECGGDANGPEKGGER